LRGGAGCGARGREALRDGAGGLLPRGGRGGARCTAGSELRTS
jgi:hypothetical protein